MKGVSEKTEGWRAEKKEQQRRQKGEKVKE